MLTLTPGRNPLHFDKTIIDDEDRSFIEVYWLRRLDEGYPEVLRTLSECVAEDTPQTLLVLGYSTIGDETPTVRQLLAAQGIQTCFAHEFADWLSEVV